MRRRVLAVLALLCGLSLLVPSTASAVPVTHNRADAAAGWLARQMVDGERFEVDFGGVLYPDAGLTIDGVFAFAAARSADDYADRAIAWLSQPAITSGYTGSGGEAYAGAHAKLMPAAQGQCHVDARGHANRGRVVAVDDDPVFRRCDTELGEVLERGPVGGRPAAVEDAGGGEDEGLGSVSGSRPKTS